MKKEISVLFLSLILLLTACAEKKDRYINLANGASIEVEKDDKTGYMINKETKEPVYIYIDTKNNDTIYGKTGKVINGHVILNGENKYVYDEDEKLKIDESGAVKYKDDDYKMEVEKDGDIKIKDGDDKKVKIDGETGERKTKKD